MKRKVQTYFCKDCNKYFSSKRRKKNNLIKKIWEDYVFGKQTFRELKCKYVKDNRTIRDLLNNYIPQLKNHKPRFIHLITDGTYFGERKENTSWCSVVGRCFKEKENLWWRFVGTETTSIYREMRNGLESLGYKILSVTGDGFGGIRQAFSGIPFQMCHVHMERLVVKGTTNNPQTEAGQVLLALVKTLPNTDKNTFNRRIFKYSIKYKDFLNQRSINPETGEMFWTHKPLKQAFNSVLNLQEFLFTYQEDRDIPTTTNSLEGHFRHIKEVVSIHCGLSRKFKQKVLHSIFLAGSIAPNKKKLDEIM